MPEIRTESIPASQPLFSDLENSHALVQLAMAGRLAARIFVDEVTSPSAGAIVYHGRVLLAGKITQPGFIRGLGDWFSQEIVPAHLEVGDDAFLVCYPDSELNAAVEGLFDGCKIYHSERQYYEIKNFQSTELPSLPDGYSIQLITHEFITSQVLGLESVREEMCSERLSVDDFLDHSFGLCLVFENEVAGWCMSEYNIVDRCEIGIATLEKHQRKGLATLQARYFLQEAHRRGYRRVGWDCWRNNIASGATARKAGLTLVEEYPAMVAVFERKGSQDKEGSSDG